MRIAYFDLGLSREDYSLNPRRYGGGAVVGRFMKEDPEVDFHIFAPAEAFENVGLTERRDRCHGLSPEGCAWLREGNPVDAVLDQAQFVADIVLHGHTCETIMPRWKRNGHTRFSGPPIVHWAGFDGSCGHPGNDYILLYDDAFKAQFGERAKYVRIGKPVPATPPTGAKDMPGFVFQCSRHDDTMNTISVAKECLAHDIKGVFAGPIHNGYPLLDYIDNKTTIYLGEIDETTKLDYCRRARLFTLNHTWPKMPFNQSVIEAQGQGTPIWANGDGYFLSHYLRHGVNGWDSRRMSLIDAFGSPLWQEHCWKAAREYDVSVMTASFKKAFNEIVTEWRTK